MFEFDKRRAKKLLIDRLFGAYYGETHLFKYVHAKNGDAPQHKYWPADVKKGSYEHQVFLFFATLLTYRSGSEEWFRQCAALFGRSRFMFFREVLEMDFKMIESHLRTAEFVHPAAAARYWKENARTLFNAYGGDPLKIFSNGTIRGVMKLKKESRGNLFPGYGPKLLSLLALFYIELDLIDPVADAFPCDLHVQNQCISLGLVKAESNMIDAYKLADFLRINLSDLCNKNGVSALDLSHAMWFLGNRICIECNRKRRISERLCPIMDCCGGRISTLMYRKKGKWKTEKDSLPLIELINTG